MQLWLTNLILQARYLVVILLGLAGGGQRRRAAAGTRWPRWRWPIVIGYFGAAAGGLTGERTFFAQARDVARVRRLRRRFGVIEGGERRSKKYVN